MTSIKQAKKVAFELYKLLRSKKLYCPAFQENVVVSLLGWRHLVNPVGRTRTVADLYRRLKLIEYIEPIVTSSGTIYRVRVRYGKTYYILEATIVGFPNGYNCTKKICIVFINTPNGKTFLSIMSKRKK